MELATITMDREQARTEWQRYRQAVLAPLKREQDVVAARVAREDRVLMTAYKALSQGQQLLRMGDTIKAGGVDERLVPRLGIARADQARVTVRRNRQGRVSYAPPAPRRGADLHWRQQAKQPTSLLFDGVFPAGSTAAAQVSSWEEWVATVPAIPVQYRPTAAGLANYHVLFEATWQASPQAGDPALVKHLGGDLWIVLATWDLTELEAAVLGMRRA